MDWAGVTIAMFLLAIIIWFLYMVIGSADWRGSGTKAREAELLAEIQAQRDELVKVRAEISYRAGLLLEEWKRATMDTAIGKQVTDQVNLRFEEHRVAWERAIREDAIAKHKAVTGGQAVEHLIPFTATFGFNPKDARFLGAPVDLIVFDGLTLDALRRIVFLEIKTGDGAALSARERAIRDCVKRGAVEWAELRVGR